MNFENDEVEVTIHHKDFENVIYANVEMQISADVKTSIRDVLVHKHKEDVSNFDLIKVIVQHEKTIVEKYTHCFAVAG